MKNHFIKSIVAIMITGSVFSSCSITSHTEKAEGVDFSRYKSFGWINSGNEANADRSDNEIVDNNIKNSVSYQLEKQGWVENNNNPDVLLDYTVAVKKGVTREREPVYISAYPLYMYRRGGMYGHGGMYAVWNPSMLMGYRNYNVPFREGELNINMLDAKTKKLIWQGWAQGDINSSNVTSKEADAQVKSIFKKFNYPNA